MDKITKTVIVQGNLKDSKISYKFLPNELSQGKWRIRLQSLSYSLNGPQNLKDICVITSNLVTGLTYSETNIVSNYEQPFGMLIFDPKIKRKTINFDINWLTINVYSNELILTLTSLEKKQRIDVDGDVYFLIQLLKI